MEMTDEEKKQYTEKEPCISRFHSTKYLEANAHVNMSRTTSDRKRISFSQHGADRDDLPRSDHLGERSQQVGVAVRVS